MWTRCALSLILFQVLALPSESRANSSADILKGESIDLFRKDLGREEAPAVCEFSEEWYEEKFAQERLGELLVKHVGPLGDANSAHSRPPFTPAEILDPTGDLGRSFCSDDEYNAYAKARYEESKKKSNPEQVAMPGGVGILEVSRREYNFPVFNADYTKAAFVACGAKSIVYATAMGQSFDHQSGCIVEYYVKRNSIWEFKDQERLWIE